MRCIGFATRSSILPATSGRVMVRAVSVIAHVISSSVDEVAPGESTMELPGQRVLRQRLGRCAHVVRG